MNAFKRILPIAPLLWCAAITVGGVAWAAEDAPDAPLVVPSQENQPEPNASDSKAGAKEQLWNWHIQNTDIVQYHPGFHADYSGPNSMHNYNEVKETVSLDLMTGIRLWRGAEFHVDGMMWQGFGLSDARGIDGFPNGEAFRLGNSVPNVTFARVFIRQTIGLGGPQEEVQDDFFQLAGKRDISRVTLTVGKLSAKDIFDNNAYANDPRTQFLSWALMANEAWDYPADSLGYMTGFAAELNQAEWTARYGFFQVPSTANGVAIDMHVLEAWAMVGEFERRYSVGDLAGTVRLLAFLNRANMGSYQATLDDPALNMDISLTRAYRLKYGFGLNVDQDLGNGVGIFSRLGWSNGQTEAWMFSDVDRTATLGVTVKGNSWRRPGDTFGLAGILNGLSQVHREFFAAGGLGILAGDGALTYGWERILETYYDFQIWRTLHGTLDYQYVTNPAFNQARGPISVFAARLHWSF